MAADSGLGAVEYQTYRTVLCAPENLSSPLSSQVGPSAYPGPSHQALHGLFKLFEAEPMISSVTRIICTDLICPR